MKMQCQWEGVSGMDRESASHRPDTREREREREGEIGRAHV